MVPSSGGGCSKDPEKDGASHTTRYGRNYCLLDGLYSEKKKDLAGCPVWNESFDVTQCKGRNAHVGETKKTNEEGERRSKRKEEK